MGLLENIIQYELEKTFKIKVQYDVLVSGNIIMFTEVGDTFKEGETYILADMKFKCTSKTDAACNKEDLDIIFDYIFSLIEE